MDLAFSKSFDPCAAFGSDSDSDEDEGDEGEGKEPQSKAETCDTQEAPKKVTKTTKRKSEFDLDTLKACGYSSPKLRIGKSPAEIATVRKVQAEARAAEKREIEIETKFQDTVKKARRFIADDRREVREWARAKDQRRKLTGSKKVPGIATKGSWVEGMGSIAHRMNRP